jgi:hypothetical protein
MSTESCVAIVGLWPSLTSASMSSCISRDSLTHRSSPGLRLVAAGAFDDVEFHLP